ncbi:MAG TPA: UvrB/UvrC motif-containing protein, partial [Streptosporangiaceae bacterium]
GLGADHARVRAQVLELLPGGGKEAAEAAARARLVRTIMPKDLRELEEQLAQVRRQKEAAIDAEDFETAAALRDREQELLVRKAKRE